MRKRRERGLMRAKDEQGTALILSLFLTLVASVMSASLIFLAQTETWSSTNYRLMAQARYGAESGLSKAANFLQYSYAKPGTGADPLANYDMTVSPVTRNGQRVILSANASTASNYPVAAVQTAFNTAARGTLPIGNINVQYAPYATLLSMQVVGTDTIQRWLITSDGTITSGTRTAQVQVSGILDQEVTPLLPVRGVRHVQRLRRARFCRGCNHRQLRFIKPRCRRSGVGRQRRHKRQPDRSWQSDDH